MFPTAFPRRYSRSATVPLVAAPLRRVAASIMKVMMAVQLHTSLTARSAVTRPVTRVEVACSTLRKVAVARRFMSMITILQGGATGGNILNQGGAVISDGYNLSNDSCGGLLTGPGDLTNIEAMLGPLQDNGGPTLTHSLLPGSPAINAGDPSFTPPPFYDQRGPGFDRVVNGRIDIGSFEAQGPIPRATPLPRPHPTVCPALLRGDASDKLESVKKGSERFGFVTSIR